MIASMTDYPLSSALIFAASGGIGGALADALEGGGAAVDRLSRSGDGVDLTDEASVAAAADERAQRGASYDLIINAAGALDVAGKGPEKAFKEIDAAAMTEAFRVNAVGGALFLKHFSPLLADEGRAVFASLSARIGSIGDNRLGGWMSYRASKAALNQIVRCASVEIKRSNLEAIVVALHPGTIKTPLTEKYAKGRYTASREEAAQNLLTVLARLAPDDNGGFFDYAGEAIVW